MGKYPGLIVESEKVELSSRMTSKHLDLRSCGCATNKDKTLGRRRGAGVGGK